jgi:hypothetical protein
MHHLQGIWRANLLVSLLLLAGASSAYGEATVATDKENYSPGETPTQDASADKPCRWELLESGPSEYYPNATYSVHRFDVVASPPCCSGGGYTTMYPYAVVSPCPLNLQEGSCQIRYNGCCNKGTPNEYAQIYYTRARYPYGSSKIRLELDNDTVYTLRAIEEWNCIPMPPDMCDDTPWYPPTTCSDVAILTPPVQVEASTWGMLKAHYR